PRDQSASRNLRLCSRPESLKVVSVPIRPDDFPPRSVRWTFLLFAASLPLEVAHAHFLGWSVSWARLAGVPFVVCYLWYHRPWSGHWHVPRVVPAVAWMGACLAVYAVTGLMGRDDPAKFLTRFLALLQLFPFLWVVSDLLADADLARRTMLAYALG